MKLSRLWPIIGWCCRMRTLRIAASLVDMTMLAITGGKSARRPNVQTFCVVPTESNCKRGGNPYPAAGVDSDDVPVDFFDEVAQMDADAELDTTLLGQSALRSMRPFCTSVT